MFATSSRAVGVLVGWLADLAFADPRRGHPVAGFGTVAGALERATYRDTRLAGIAHAGILVGAVTLLTIAMERTAARFGFTGRTAVLAAATWSALGGTSLLRTVSDMSDTLTTQDIDAARRLLPSLCGRDPEVLDGDGLARAALESLAENTSDAQVAPMFWAAVGGVPGALGYRAVNTLDAMIGYRSSRYARFGWAAARLDDIANIVPARVSATLAALCAPLIGGSPASAVRAWRRDAPRHPSPNAGVVEAAFVGALGVRLGGPTRYPYGLEIRPALGDGPPPHVADLRRAVKLSRWVQAAAAVLAVGSVSAFGRSDRPASARR